MSKVVKKVGRAIGKVVNGVKKAVSSVWKKIKENDVLRTIAVAAAVFVTGGAALGAIGGGLGATAGGSFLSTLGNVGMGALKGALGGIKAAWGGITAAAGNLAQGKFAAAGQSLMGQAGGSTGIMNAYGAGAQAAGAAGASLPAYAANAGTAAGNAAGGAANTVGPLKSGYALSQGAGSNVVSQMGNIAGSSITAPATQAAGTAVANMAPVATSTPDYVNTANQFASAAQQSTEAAQQMSLFDRMIASPYTAPALINVGGQMLGGYASARAAEEQEREARERYGRNMGSRLNLPYRSYTDYMAGNR